MTRWPKPTTKPPDWAELLEWGSWDTARATDGCEVEMVGTCKHGHPSWVVVLQGGANDTTPA